MVKTIALIAAAGCGSRFGGLVPKQYSTIKGDTILGRTLKTFIKANLFDEIVVIASANDQRVDQYAYLSSKIRIEKVGGITRAHSVLNGLNTLQCNSDDWVAVHDAARCLLTVEFLQNALNSIKDDPVGGIVALKVTDTVKTVDTNHKDALMINKTIDRDTLYLAQTPQIFRFGILHEAFNRADGSNMLDSITDESSCMENMGHMVRILPGDATNIKITTQNDCMLATHILNCR